jgi:ABC-2 type transport system permease protein
MTTLATHPTAELPTDHLAPRLSFRGVLRSELGKLTSLRSTRVAAVGVVPLVVAGAVLHAFVYAHTRGPEPVTVSSRAAWQYVLAGGADAGELVGAVLAALLLGSEYAARVLLTTFVAAPRRLLVGAAKVVALLAPLAVLVAVGLLAGAALSTPLLTTVAPAGPPAAALGVAAGDVVVVLVCSLLGLSATALVRSAAGGITIVLAVLLVLPVVVPLLHPALGVDLAPFLLTYAAPMAAALHDPAGPGALVRDVLVTAAWVVVPGAGAAVALVRRDV